MHEVLIAVKTELAANPRFRKFVATHMLAKGFSGSPMQLVQRLLDTYDIVHAEAEDQHGHAVSAHVLVGEPFLDSKQACDEYIGFFTAASFWVGASRLSVNAVRIHCNLCKVDVHNTYACPLPRIPGWLGPSNADEIKEHEMNQKNAIARDLRREKETSSTELFGKAKRGGRGRDNTRAGSSRGFQEVKRGKKRERFD
ncbi:hypothetical protein HDZ31DRAFT_68582 [Schizophyllum fasciatum]